MRFRAKLFLLFFTLMAASVLVLAAACGGDDDEDTPSDGDGSPAATQTAAPADETQEPSDDEDGNGDGDGEAPDIASPPGASETFSGTFTGGDLPFGGFAGISDLDPEEFGEVRYTVFETDDSVDSMVDFYKKEFKGWKEEFSFGGDAEGEAFKMMVWSRDDGKVGAWMMATEGDGTTSVVVVTGAQ
jgi:hypothetical protein